MSARYLYLKHISVDFLLNNWFFFFRKTRHRIFKSLNLPIGKFAFFFLTHPNNDFCISFLYSSWQNPSQSQSLIASFFVFSVMFLLILNFLIKLCNSTNLHGMKYIYSKMLVNFTLSLLISHYRSHIAVNRDKSSINWSFKELHPSPICRQSQLQSINIYQHFIGYSGVIWITVIAGVSEK